MRHVLVHAYSSVIYHGKGLVCYGQNLQKYEENIAPVKFSEASNLIEITRSAEFLQRRPNRTEP